LGRRVDLRQIAHHDVGARIAQRQCMPAAIDADHASEPTGVPGLDACNRVLDNDRARGFSPEASGRLEKCIRRRLAPEGEACEVRPVHPRIEQ